VQLGPEDANGPGALAGKDAELFGLGEAAPEGQLGAAHPRNRVNTHVEILCRHLEPPAMVEINRFGSPRACILSVAVRLIVLNRVQSSF
jgi:hypothetical protein